jgi:uncharacterized membrane protein
MAQVSITSAYMWSFVTMAVCFGFAVISANMILYKSNNTGVTKRRIWFWALCVATGVVSYLINSYISSGITVPTKKTEYDMHSAIAAVCVIVVYFILGFVLSKVCKNSKIGTWFN